MDPALLQSLILRHEMAARQLDEAEADKIVRLLNETIEDMKERLAGRYVKAQAKGVDRGPATTKRIEEMLEGFEAVNREVYQKIGQRVEGQLIERARQEMQFTGDATKAAGAKIVTANTIPDTNYFRTLVRNSPIPVDEHTAALLEPWLKGMEAGNLDRLGKTLRTSFAQGLSPADMIKAMEAGGFAKSRASAQSLVLTANASVANQSRLDTYRRMKTITHVEWSSILDSRTTPGCQDLSGKIWSLDEQHPTPPRHIRCRSMLIPRRNGTDKPLHKTYAEWLAEQSGDVQAEVQRKRGSIKTIDDLKDFDAAITKDKPPEKPRFVSPVNAATTAESIVVRPKRAITQELTRKLTPNAIDPRYDPRPEFKGIKAEDFGKAALGTGWTDEAASMVAAILPEVDAITDAFAIPAIRAIKTTSGRAIATMGDGTLSMNPTFFAGYAADVGAKAESASVALLAQRDTLTAELTAMRKDIDKIKATISTLSGPEKDAAIMSYLDQADAFNAKRNEYIRLQKKIGKARSTDNAANRPVSTWKPGDDPATRPFNATDYFSGIDRARNVIFHELGHHVHQMLNKTGRRHVVGLPPLERRLAIMFNQKFGRLGVGREAKMRVSTTYGTENAYEWWAESFGLYMMGRKDLVDPDLLELIDELLEEVRRG